MMKEQVFTLLKAAMKNKDTLAKGVYQILKSNLENAEKEKKAVLTVDEEIAIVQREVKQTNQALEGAVQANRADLIEKEKTKLVLLEKFLPKQLNEDEVQIALLAAGVKTGMNMGDAMKIARPLLNGLAPNATISTVAKKIITG